MEIDLQVHDSIAGEMPAKHAKEFALEAKRIMEDQPWSIVRHVADCKTGPSWGKATDLL